MEALEFRFAFYARDFDRSVRFYKEILKMPQVGGWDRPDGKGALLSAGGSAVIEIYGPAEGKTYTGSAPVAINLALRLEDSSYVDRWYWELISAGVKIAGPPVDHIWGHRSFIAYDPDGIPVHFYCEISRP